jgi:hypothetical protein
MVLVLASMKKSIVVTWLLLKGSIELYVLLILCCRNKYHTGFGFKDFLLVVHRATQRRVEVAQLNL